MNNKWKRLIENRFKLMRVGSKDNAGLQIEDIKK